MLRIHYIPVINDSFGINSKYDILYDLSPFNITWSFQSDIIEDGNWSNSMLE